MKVYNVIQTSNCDGEILVNVTPCADLHSAQAIMDDEIRTLLSEGKYDEFVDLVRKTYKFREKFEVMTETECKHIKDPKQFENGLAKVIGDYLASQGIKDTSVDVRYIENW